MWLSVIVYAPLSLLTIILPYPLRYWFISRWACFQLWLLKVLCRLDYSAQGAEHLPKGAAIILSKHQSAWETIAFQKIFPPQTWVLKRELLWIPLFGWALMLLRPIAIDRSAGRRAIEQVVAQGRQRLQSGLWVVVFPEGTRVAHNAGSFWPRRGFLKRSGHVRVVIGPVIDSRGKSAEEIRKLAEEWIENKMLELEKTT